MVIVDTTIWIDYLNGVSTPHTEWLHAEASRQRLALTNLILCEVLQGISTEREATAVLRELTKFEVYETGSRSLSIEAARNYRQLRARGRTVRRTIDCLIATFCVMNDHELLHNDRDFDAFEQLLNLRVVHP